MEEQVLSEAIRQLSEYFEQIPIELDQLEVYLHGHGSWVLNCRLQLSL
jgi:hypothetical protein